MHSAYFVELRAGRMERARSSDKEPHSPIQTCRHSRHNLFKFVLLHDFINHDPGSFCPEVLQVPFEPFFTALALYISMRQCWLDLHETPAGAAPRKPHPA